MCLLLVGRCVSVSVLHIKKSINAAGAEADANADADADADATMRQSSVISTERRGHSLQCACSCHQQCYTLGDYRCSAAVLLSYISNHVLDDGRRCRRYVTHIDGGTATVTSTAAKDR